jgi:hypothetical protein
MKARTHMSIKSLCDTISIEIFLSFQIASVSESGKYVMFSRLCKHRIKAGTLTSIKSLGNEISTEIFLSFQIATVSESDKHVMFSCLGKNHIKAGHT